MTKIEKGIPLPPKAGHNGLSTDIQALLDNGKIGDSILLVGTTGRVTNSYASRKNRGRLATRSAGNGMVRVWKTA